MEPQPKKRGRVADVCPPAWLAHLRAWCDLSGAGGLQRYHTVPWGRYETLLGISEGKVGKWYRQLAGGGGGRAPAQLTRTDYLRLCPLLAGWHEYEPPTVEWQILQQKPRYNAVAGLLLFLQLPDHRPAYGSRGQP